ncbi:MAG TPA: SURF1 family protein [Anaerolineae bacterium]
MRILNGDAGRGWRALLRGRRLAATVAVALVCLAFCRLGFWQLQRLHERQAANAHLIARLSEPALTLTGAAVDPAATDLRHAVAHGAYDFSHEIVLRNQAFGGLPGVHLVTPLRLSGSDAAVLVDRGWIPIDQVNPASRVAFDRPASEVDVRGVARSSQTRLNFLSPEDKAPTAGGRLDQWFRVDIAKIQGQTPYPLLPVFLQEGEPKTVDLAGGPAAGSRLPAPDFQIDLSEGPHLAYAIQWFSFAAILAAGYAAYFRRQNRRTPPAGALVEEADETGFAEVLPEYEGIRPVESGNGHRS